MGMERQAESLAPALLSCGKAATFPTTESQLWFRINWEIMYQRVPLRQIQQRGAQLGAVLQVYNPFLGYFLSKWLTPAVLFVSHAAKPGEEDLGL